MWWKLPEGLRGEREGTKAECDKIEQCGACSKPLWILGLLI